MLKEVRLSADDGREALPVADSPELILVQGWHMVHVGWILCVEWCIRWVGGAGGIDVLMDYHRLELVFCWFMSNFEQMYLCMLRTWCPPFIFLHLPGLSTLA